MILGIDPGGRTTGWCIVDDRQPVDHGLIERGEAELTAYAMGMVGFLAETARIHDVRLVGIEGLVATVPHVHSRPINPFPIVETGVVFGTLWCGLSDLITVEVRPGEHGSAPLRTYPASLVGARETKGTGKMRHARSAYDVALASRSALRIREATR